MLNWYIKWNVLQITSTKGILYLGVKGFNQSHIARLVTELKLEPKAPNLFFSPSSNPFCPLKI